VLISNLWLARPILVAQPSILAASDAFHTKWLRMADLTSFPRYALILSNRSDVTSPTKSGPMKLRFLDSTLGYDVFTLEVRVYTFISSRNEFVKYGLFAPHISIRKERLSRLGPGVS